MKAEILAVGTEILLGDIVNTNAQFLSKELASIGISVYRQEVIGDNEDRLLEAFEEAFKRSDVIITTGGLGPTGDDLTKETACKYFGMEMVLHEESYEALKGFFSKIKKEISQSNMKQVYFPKEGIVLSNPNGTAPGAILKKDNKTIIILPGPPKEMKPMYLNHVKNYLMPEGFGVIKSEVVRILGLGESTAAEKLKDIIDAGVNPTIAPYAKQEDVIFRITASGKTEEEALEIIKPIKEKVKARLGIDCYGEGEDNTIEQVVGTLLIERDLSISTAESCTGGMIASRLVAYPGISQVFLEGAVTYSNESKTRTLGVSCETLEKYGAVSEQIAKEMALGIANRTDSDVSVVTTGIAGPGGGTKEKPVGLVYIGLYYKGAVKAYRYEFNGDRDKIRTSASIKALDKVRRVILEGKLL
ncbi:competence/damage-inducible protein A [Clostridium vincentii]|uniref:Putative competence-damage inducible protein n=1 Tax=Clostridium vincentii TaxID=52704 RepID=A0A2T0B821_9CLOT|nr:competence/damage-inducible protein A [Clostridium vincentii]PRR79973.1 putative competence-damage inducible protein [Clostridium vincentii]